MGRMAVELFYCQITTHAYDRAEVTIFNKHILLQWNPGLAQQRFSLRSPISLPPTLDVFDYVRNGDSCSRHTLVRTFCGHAHRTYSSRIGQLGY